MPDHQKDGVLVGDDKKMRCWWHGNDPLYCTYHDEEWGVPTDNDYRLFEKLCLEGFQAGLSWITILRKREGFRKAFLKFDPARIIKFTEKDIARLMGDTSIVRHRGKIEAVIHNAKGFDKIVKEFGSFAAYIWQFEPLEGTNGDYKKLRATTVTIESQKLSKDLKKRGFKFVGPTTCYSFMQVMGMVNDHVTGCYCRKIRDKERKLFTRPTNN